MIIFLGGLWNIEIQSLRDPFAHHTSSVTPKKQAQPRHIIPKAMLTKPANAMEYAAGSVMNYFSDSHEEKKDDEDVVVAPPPAAAAAAIKNDEEDKTDSPRRTGRKRTSTTMIIDGHVVKTVSDVMDCRRC